MITRRRRDERGQSMVEFALIVPIFLLILFGILDLGRAVYAYDTINNAAREGARVAIVNQTLAVIQARAADRAVGTGVRPTDVTVDYRSSDTPDVADSCDAMVGNPADSPIGCTAVVTVDLDFTAATPIVSAIIGVVSLQGQASMEVQFGCQDPILPCPDTD